MRLTKTILKTMLFVFTAGYAGFSIWMPAVEAAKKYYPPGFTPSSGSAAPQPEASAPKPTAPVVRGSGAPQVIIRTVPARRVQKDPLTTLVEERRFYEALRLVDKKLQQSPGSLSLRFIRAEVLRGREEFEQSATEYRFILAKTKNKTFRVKAYSGLGMAQLEHAQKITRLGNTAEAQVLMEQAEGSFKQALAVDTRYPEALNGMAQVALAQNHPAEAEVFVKRALRYAPNDSEVLLTESRLLLDQGSPDEAIPLIFKAKRQAARDPEVSLLLGRAYLAMERYDDAIIHLQQTLEMVPDQTDALKLLSAAYESKQKTDDAEMALQKAVSLNPSDVEAAKSLLKLYDQRGESERGILLLKTLLKDQPQNIIGQKELLERLITAERWTEAFAQGATVIDALTLPTSGDTQALDGFLSLFVRTAYVKGKGLIDRQGFLTQPAVEKVMAYSKLRAESNPTTLTYRLNMLLLDPLVQVAPLPSTASLLPEQLPIALQITFLQGDWTSHRSVLSRIQDEKSLTPGQLKGLVQQLIALGDYSSAQLLVASRLKLELNPTEIIAISDTLQQAQQKADERLKGLEMLPGRIPREHWRSTAEEALQFYAGNWKLHKLLADDLMDHREYDLAAVQQELTARYAPSEREKSRWLKKAQKTKQRLAKANKR